MTVDVRCTVVTDQGISTSGSLSEDHIDGNNVLATVRGTIEFLGIKNLTRETVVNVAYTVPGFNEITRFPRRLRILSSKVDPFAEVTTAQVGCILALKSDLRPPDAIAASANEPSWVTALPANMATAVPVPIYARDVLAYCLSKLGITAASGNEPLVSAFLREELDLSGGYVQVINDLLASEACYGFVNTAEQFVVRKVLTTGATGPVLTRDQLITMEGIEGGAPPADQIRVIWSGAVQAPPGLVLDDVPVLPLLPADPGGTLDLTPEQETGIDTLLGDLQTGFDLTPGTSRGILNQTIIASGATPVSGSVALTSGQYAYVIANAPVNAQDYVDQRRRTDQNPDDPTANPPLRNWTYEQTISPVRTFVQAYITPAGADAIDVVAFAATSTNVTTFADVAYIDKEGNPKTESVAIQRVSATTDRVGPANPTRWKSKLENGSPARAADELIKGSITTYTNVGLPDGVRVKEEETIEYEPRISFASKLGIQNWVGIDLGLENVAVSRTLTSYEWDEVADSTKVTTSRWLAWGATTEGSTGGAALAKALEQLDDAARIAGILRMVDNYAVLMFDGSEVRITQGRGTAQKRGSDQDRGRDALSRDPLTGLPRSGTGSAGVGLDYSADGLPTGTATYTLPYPADDVLEGVEVDPQTLRAEIVPGNVEEQARVYGEMRNYLAFGHSNGVAITTEIRNVPTEPLGAMFIEAAGVSGVFRANGTNWVWGGDGMIVGSDALLAGTAGTYEAPEFDDCWVPVPVSITSLPTLSAATTNSNPKPANTITLPGGFDPTAPGSIWGSLPTDGTDVPAKVRTISRMVKPRNERVKLRARSRSRALLQSYDYLLDLGTTELQAVSRSNASLLAVVTLPLTTIAVTALAPTVGSPAEVTLPLTTITVTAPAPSVEQAGVALVLPVSTLAVTAPVPSVAAADPNFSNVSLLLPLDGTNGSTTFNDASNNAFGVNSNGNAQLSTAQSKFGGASVYFDGAGDSLSIASSTAFGFGTGAFTVELHFRPTANGSASGRSLCDLRDAVGGTPWTIYFKNTGSGNFLGMYYASGTSYAEWSGAGQFLSLNQWYHIALVRSGSSYLMFLDGVQLTVSGGSATAVDLGSTKRFRIGTAADGTSDPITGYVDNVRVTKGIARYTAGFTPPSAAFPTQ